MTCYQRHISDVFEELDLAYDAENRRAVDDAIRAVLGTPSGAHCPDVWAAIKALGPDGRAELASRVGEQLAT